MKWDRLAHVLGTNITAADIVSTQLTVLEVDAVLLALSSKAVEEDDDLIKAE